MESTKKVFLFAKDVAPCQALDLLSKKMSEVGESSFPLLCFGKEQTSYFDTAMKAVSNADAVVVGMSSSKQLSRDEITIAKYAADIGKSVFLYSADVFGLRPHFSEVLSNRFTTLFCINEQQAEQAQRKYPDLNVVVTGNPMWDNFFYTTTSRESTRELLKVRSEDVVILCPGGKDIVVNILLFNAAIECCARSGGCILYISLHPGDKTQPEVYQSLIDFAPSNVKVTILRPTFISASDILPGADGVFSSVSTIDIEAICRTRPIPVISFISPIARRRLERATGRDEYELIEKLTAIEQHTSFDLISFIRYWAGLGEYSEQIIRIRRHFPKPEKIGSSLEKMMDAIFESV